MKNMRIISLVVVFTLIYACESKPKEENTDTEVAIADVNKLNLDNLVKEIKKREEAYRNENTPNNRNGILLMEAYAAYSERFSNYENAAEYLFKAGEIAMGEELTVKALKYLDRLYNEFPNYEKRAYGLFLKAFILENQANNLDEAKLTYEQFIREFPTHEMVDDAQASIKNLGKSPEEIIREFEIQDSIRKAEGQGV